MGLPIGPCRLLIALIDKIRNCSTDGALWIPTSKDFSTNLSSNQYQKK